MAPNTDAKSIDKKSNEKSKVRKPLSKVKELKNTQALKTSAGGNGGNTIPFTASRPNCC